MVEHYTTITIHGEPVCVREGEREGEREEREGVWVYTSDKYACYGEGGRKNLRQGSQVKINL